METRQAGPLVRNQQKFGICLVVAFQHVKQFSQLIAYKYVLTWAALLVKQCSFGSFLQSKPKDIKNFVFNDPGNEVKESYVQPAPKKRKLKIVPLNFDYNSDNCSNMPETAAADVTFENSTNCLSGHKENINEVGSHQLWWIDVVNTPPPLRLHLTTLSPSVLLPLHSVNDTSVPKSQKHKNQKDNRYKK